MASKNYKGVTVSLKKEDYDRLMYVLSFLDCNQTDFVRNLVLLAIEEYEKDIKKIKESSDE